MSTADRQRNKERIMLKIDTHLAHQNEKLSLQAKLGVRDITKVRTVGSTHIRLPPPQEVNFLAPTLRYLPKMPKK